MSFAVTGTLLTVGATAYGAREGRKAADAVKAGADAATAESARQYDQTRADLSSGRSLYEGANAILGRLYGIPVTTSDQFTAEQPQLVGDTELPAGTTTKSVGDGWYEVWYGGNRIGTLRPGGPNGRFINDTGADIPGLLQQSRQAPVAARTPAGPSLDPFFASPDYNFRRTEGTRAIENTFAARGGGASGNALRRLAEFNSNLAAGEFDSYTNRLFRMAGLGADATERTAAYGAENAATAGRNALIAGDARASGIENRTNLITGGAESLAGLWGYLGGRKKPLPVGDMGAYGGSGINPYTGRRI